MGFGLRRPWGPCTTQAEQTFENLKAALAASGASFDNVVKLNSYFVDIKQAPVFREVRDKYINVTYPPASTAVEIRRLVREEWLLEGSHSSRSGIVAVPQGR